MASHPSETTSPDPVRSILGYTHRIAVVGLSDSPWRTSHDVASVLQRTGYEIVPVNPNIGATLGVPAYPTLADVPGPIDLVNVFRREQHLAAVAEQAAAVGARGLWNQLGLRSAAARRVAEEAGMDYVEDRCLKIEVRRLQGEMELPPVA